MAAVALRQKHTQPSCDHHSDPILTLRARPGCGSGDDGDWYELGWVPGQTSPGPKGNLKVRLLLSSVVDLEAPPPGMATGTVGRDRSARDMRALFGPAAVGWNALRSYDFLAISQLLKDNDTAVASGKTPLLEVPVEARLQWHLHEVCHKAFAMVDVDGGGTISADELLHLMLILGERLSEREVALMLVEGNRENLLADGTVDLLLAELDEAAFTRMLTEYEAEEKGVSNGIRSYDAQASPRQLPPWMEQMVVLHGDVLRESQAGQLPTPIWLQEQSGLHQPLTRDRRRPEVFWKFLRRKMEQMLLLQAKAGVADAGLFRRADATGPTHFAGGWTVRDTGSTFNSMWDLVQVSARAVCQNALVSFVA